MDGALLDQLTWAFFGAFLVASGFSDLRSHRLPNWLMLAGALLGLLLSSLRFGVSGLEASGLGLLLGIGLLFLPFVFKIMGAGDVKLLGAIGAFLGPENTLWALLAGSVAGGILSLVAYLGPAQEGGKRKKIPYGVALALGALFAAFRGGFAGGWL